MRFKMHSCFRGSTLFNSTFLSGLRRIQLVSWESQTFSISLKKTFLLLAYLRAFQLLPCGLFHLQPFCRLLDCSLKFFFFQTSKIKTCWLPSLQFANNSSMASDLTIRTLSPSNSVFRHPRLLILHSPPTIKKTCFTYFKHIYFFTFLTLLR